ncbi:MAG: hypothetical protein ACE5GS_01280 [Kiloniellaceae bacterium]
MSDEDRLPGAEFRARGLREVYLLCFVLGCGGLALAAVFEDFRTLFSIFLFVTVTLLGTVGLFDRRVKLSLSPDGIRYERWGRAVVPWHEFRAYRPVRWSRNPYLQLIPRQPARVLRHFSWLGKLNNRCARLIGQPPFSIAVTPLDIVDWQLEAVIRTYLPCASDT